MWFTRQNKDKETAPVTHAPKLHSTYFKVRKSYHYVIQAKGLSLQGVGNSAHKGIIRKEMMEK